MSAELKSLDSLSDALREPIRRYSQRLQEVTGPNALGLTFYGAVAAGHFNPARHVIHNVLVLDTVDLELLKRLASELPSSPATRIAAPLVLTPTYIRASLDTFPLELIEIQQQHRTIFGEDHFESLVFESVHVRLHCERELKTMLLAMRQVLLLSEGSDKKIAELTQHAGDGILRTLRGLLWLKGHTSAIPSGRAIQMLEETISRPLPGVRDLLNEQSSRDWSHFQKLYGELDALGSLSDRW